MISLKIKKMIKPNISNERMLTNLAANSFSPKILKNIAITIL